MPEKEGVNRGVALQMTTGRSRGIDLMLSMGMIKASQGNLRIAVKMSEQPVNTDVSTPAPKDQFNLLPDADRERLVAAFENTPPELFVRPFASAVAQRAATNPKFVEELCYFLAEWFTLLSENPDYLERIVEFLAVSAEGIPVTQDLESRRGQWRRLMQSDGTLGVTLKAFNILRRQANAYQKSVTTTEIRPVYLTDPTQAPKHAIVLHHLHITYQTEYGTQTVHVAIDGPAIVAMIEVLRRALTKENTLLDQKAYEYLGRTRDEKH